MNHYVYYGNNSGFVATLSQVDKDTAILTACGDDIISRIIDALPKHIDPKKKFYPLMWFHHPTDLQIWKVSLFTCDPDTVFTEVLDLITNTIGIKPTQLIPKSD